MAWTRNPRPNRALPDRYTRSDGAIVDNRRGGLRPWSALRPDCSGFLRAKRRPDRPTTEGPIRTFRSAKAAMEAVDETWPLAADARPVPAVEPSLIDDDRIIVETAADEHRNRVACDTAFVQAMMKAIQKGREVNRAGTFVDTSPTSARTIRGEPLMSCCGSPSALCAETSSVGIGTGSLK